MANEVSETLQNVLRTLTTQKDQIDRQIAAIESALGAMNGAATTKTPRRRKRMTQAERDAVGKRMKVYWAKRRKEAATTKGKRGKGRPGTHAHRQG